MRQIGLFGVLLILWVSCGGKPRVVFPKQLPHRPVTWPLPAGINVIQLRGEALQARGEGSGGPGLRDGVGSQGEAREGEAREAEAREGEAREGEAREGEAREAEVSEGETREGEVSEGEAREGEAREGAGPRGAEPRGAGPRGARRLRALSLVGRLTGLMGPLEKCAVGHGTHMDRVILGLPSFDRVLSGATVILQGNLDAPRVVECLLRLPTRLALKSFKLGPYPGARGRAVARSVLVMAIAQNTLVVAVGDQAGAVPLVLAGRAQGIGPKHYEVHFGKGAEGAAYTVTVSRFFRSNPSILTSPIRALILVTRSAWLQVWLRGGGEVSLDGALMTGGRFATFRLELQWKLVTKAIALADRDARVVLAALKATPIDRGLLLHMNGGPVESAAMKRLSRRLMGRLSGRRGARRGSAVRPGGRPGKQ